MKPTLGRAGQSKWQIAAGATCFVFLVIVPSSINLATSLRRNTKMAAGTTRVQQAVYQKRLALRQLASVDKD